MSAEAEERPEHVGEMVLYEDEATGQRVALRVLQDRRLYLESKGFNGALLLSRSRCAELLEWMGTYHLDDRWNAIEQWLCEVKDANAQIRDDTATEEVRASIRGAFVHILTNIVEAYFVDAGGRNFVISEMETEDGERLSLTIQRAEGLTPLQLLHDVRRQAADLADRLQDCRLTAQAHLNRAEVRGSYDAPWQWRARRRDAEEALREIERVAGAGIP
ncbi:MAG: hypothetical protein GF320_11320 [Armatimonadia bacterium]|nr:hypothetical protein [Armatimonadia bacterium]